jgi:hypothetical protein
MDEPQNYARLAGIFEDVFEEDSIEITPELAKDVEGWDSLMQVRLLLTVAKAGQTGNDLNGNEGMCRRDAVRHFVEYPVAIVRT